MKLQLKSDVFCSEHEPGMLRIHSPRGTFLLKNLSSSICKAIISLQTEQEEEDLENQYGEQRALLYFWLKGLEKKAVLVFKTSLVDLIPQAEEFELKEVLFEEIYHVSRFTLCRLQNDELILETPLSSVQIALKNPEALRLFYAFKKPLSLEDAAKQFPEFATKELKDTLNLLLSAKILSAEEESVSAVQWDFHDLYFHSRSRMGRHSIPFGGTYRFKGKIPPLPACKKCSSEKIISMKKPEGKSDASLDVIIEKRKSIREQGKRPITFDQLSEFLFRTARVKNQYLLDGQEMTSRPYPGGGARYELELYPVVYNCEGLERGVYHYHPLENALCQISSLTSEAEKLLRDACHSSHKPEYPQVLIVIGARFQRVSWKYQSMAYSVILKNVGVLYQTMYLTATAMKLAPCGLGGGDSDLFCRVMGTNYLEETSVGEFMLGSFPDAFKFEPR